MNNLIVKGLSLTAAAIVALGCAKDNSSSTNDDTKAYIEAWLQLNHPEATETGNGIYLLSESKGGGRPYSGETYVMLDYTITDLDGNISQTTDKKTSQRLGTYSESTYYGTRTMYVSESSIPEGLEEMLSGMSIGGEKTAVVPSWLNVYKRYKKGSQYIKHSSDNSTSIFSIRLRDFTDEIVKWEGDSLERYSRLYLGDVDSTGYGFYYLRTGEPSASISILKDTTVYINYTGRLLNGLVFDTTIADTAKFYGIYSTSKSYGPTSITMSTDYDDITMGSSSSDSGTSLITGFKMTLAKMHSGESGAGVFMSGYGYQSSGSGNSIPAFSPLRFDISLVPDPDE